MNVPWNIQPCIQHDNDQDDDDSSDGDSVILGDYVPPPLDATVDELIKQKNDPISDNIPYSTTVCLKSNYLENYIAGRYRIHLKLKLKHM